MQPEISKEDIEHVNRILKAWTLCGIMGIQPEILKQADWVKQLERAHRKLCLKVHPDKNHAPRSVEAFHTLAAAYKELVETGRDRDVRVKSQPIKPPQPEPSGLDPFTAELLRQMRKAQAAQAQQDWFNTAFKKAHYAQPSRESTEEEWRATCRANTLNGTRCTKPAFDGPYCHLHRDYDPRKPIPEKPIRVQCQAKTKVGNQCTKTTNEGQKYCTVHEDYNPSAKVPDPPAKVKCAGLTKAGKPCQSYATKGQSFCRVHQS